MYLFLQRYILYNKKVQAMDKKIYETPKVDIYEIATVGMLCASDPDKPEVIGGEGSTDDLG